MKMRSQVKFLPRGEPRLAGTHSHIRSQYTHTQTHTGAGGAADSNFCKICQVTCCWGACSRAHSRGKRRHMMICLGLIIIVCTHGDIQFDNVHGAILLLFSTISVLYQNAVSIKTFFGVTCQLTYKSQFRNSDVDRYRLVYKWVNSEGSVGGWSFGGAHKFWGVSPEVSGPLPANNK